MLDPFRLCYAVLTMGDSSSFGQSRSKVNKRELGRRQIEAAIGVMLVSRKLKLESPFVWHEDAERDVFTLEATINGIPCQWILVGEAIEDYVSDLNVRQSVDFNLASHFLPK